MSSTLSYAHAKSILSEVEKDRIVCTYLNSSEPNAIDWDKAAAEYGAASVESYKKGMQNTIKKIKKAMESGEPVEFGEGVSASVKKSGGKKRKEKAVEPGGEGEGEAEESPSKKQKKGRKTKAQKAAEEAAAAEEGEDEVKAEEDE